VNPQSRQAVQINVVTASLVTGILVLVAFLGVASAQLTAMLERRKELAVLSALGMGSRSVIKLALSEAVALGTLSLVIIIVLAGPITYYFAKVGIQLAGQSMSAVGTVIDPVMYGNFGLWFFIDAAFLSYASTFLASVYPAWFAVRLDPAEALRTA
jgi:ABC-type antimicrobial peptide transport system permease subunit